MYFCIGKVNQDTPAPIASVDSEQIQGTMRKLQMHAFMQVSERIVLAQKAYILFYIRSDDPETGSMPLSPRNASWPAQPSGSPTAAKVCYPGFMDTETSACLLYSP